MLDAATAVFSRAGFQHASMDEIARRAGVSKPMVYLYLGSKEDLFIACLRREGARMLEAIVDAVAPWQPAAPDEQLWQGLSAFFAFVGAHRDGWSVLYRQARAQQPFAAELAAMRSRMVEVLAGLLGRAVASDGRPAGQPDGRPAGQQAGQPAGQPAGQQAPADSIEILAVTLVGAAESVADWLVDRPEDDPEEAATRVMDIVWLGTRELLRGGTWRPARG